MESYAYESNKMEELFDYGPDLLSDRASFQALIDELYPTDTIMQLDVEFSSRGTSPRGPDTPPSSTGGGQEEVADPEAEHEHQAFAQGALMTEMLAGIRGSTPNDSMRSGSNVYHDPNTIESSFHDPYLSGVPSSSHSQMPAYTWESFPGRPFQYGTVYGTNFSWTDPAAANLNNANLFYPPSAQLLFDPAALIPRMSLPHVPPVQDSTANLDHQPVTGQVPIPLATLQSDNVLARYQELSSQDLMMIQAEYHFNNHPARHSSFDAVQQCATSIGHHIEAPLVSTLR